MDALLDEELIKNIAAGDRLALEALYGRHRLKLYRFLLRLANDETAAEDILTDVFFDGWGENHASIRGGVQLSRIIAEVSRTPARKFLAGLS